jgi:hypothetical protein
MATHWDVGLDRFRKHRQIQSSFHGDLGIFRRHISDTIAFHPVDDMDTKMLTEDLPIGLEILAGGHEEPLI